MTLLILVIISPDRGLSSAFQRGMMKPNAQLAKTVSSRPTPLLPPSLSSILAHPQQPHRYLSSSTLPWLVLVWIVSLSSVWFCCWGRTSGNGMFWTSREEEVRENCWSVRSGPTISPFPLWITISWEHITYYANGVFVLLPDLNDIQGLALSSWKLELEQEGKISSTTFETWILN